MSEFGSEESRLANLELTRERLGKPVFGDKERNDIVRLVSGDIDYLLFKKVQGKTNTEKLAYSAVDIRRRRNAPITVPLVSREIFFAVSHDIQRGVLHQLAGGGETVTRFRVAGVLDVLQGGQRLMAMLTMAYDPSVDKKMLEQGRVNIQLAEKDPTGRLFVDSVAGYLMSPDGAHYIESYEDPKSIAAGAKLAASTYKRMYPIVKKVLSSGR